MVSEPVFDHLVGVNEMVGNLTVLTANHAKNAKVLAYGHPPSSHFGATGQRQDWKESRPDQFCVNSED
jgi:hypothetical protein